MEQGTQSIGVAPPVTRGFSFAGLVKVFGSSGDFFDQLKTTPRILVPYLAILVVSLVAAAVAVPVLRDMSLSSPEARAKIEEQAERMGMDPDELMAQAERFTGPSIAAGIVVGRVLAPVILALLVLLFGNFILGGTASFKQALSVALYSEFLFAVGFLITSFLMAAKGGMVTLSPAVLVMDQGMQSPAFVALSQLSIFHIWQVIVLGVGIGKIYGFAGNKGLVVSVLSIGTIALVNVAFSLMGTAMGG